jgi:phytoene synthase
MGTSRGGVDPVATDEGLEIGLSEQGEGSEVDRIVAKSGSNLALALWVLPEAVRRDMRVFYAFCRVVDDLADEPEFSRSEREQGLRAWRESIGGGSVSGPRGSLAVELNRLVARHGIPPELLCEIIRGCEMDLEGKRYRSWEELRGYCFRVASAVGLVSARIFGATGCERYAEDLGLALQLTNILRDAAEDWRNGERVYLPLDEIEGCGVELGRWEREEPGGWQALMQIQKDRALGLFAGATRALPPSERRTMVAAEIMGAMYGAILQDLIADGFRVWKRRYSLSAVRKLWLMGKVWGRIYWSGS